MFFVCILKCSDASYYVGHTEDLEVRLAGHQSGEIPGWTSTRLPVRLVWSEAYDTRDGAFWMERTVKGWSRAKKEALIRGDWDAIKRLARSRSSAPPDTEEGAG